MPAEIVVVERPRGGILGRVQAARAWLRAVLRGDAIVPGRRAPTRRTRRTRRTRPFVPADAGPGETPGATTKGPTASEGLDAAARAELLAEPGAALSRSREGMLRLALEAGAAPALLRRLREDPALAFDRLLDLTIVDQIDRTGCLEVVYLCEASARGERLRVHVPLAPASAEIESVAALWPAADWLEREAFDLFGVRFRGHPGLQRLLLPADFEGAPLRRDFVATPDAVPGLAT